MANKNLKAEVEVNDWPEMEVAYVRHVGPYAGDAELFGRLSKTLFDWAGARKLINFPESKHIIIYHDDPHSTDESKLRTSVCLSVPAGTEVDGEIRKMTVAGGKYAVGRFTLSPAEYGQAWNYMYAEWLPQSGYRPDERAAFEHYPNCEENCEKMTVEIFVPVVKA